MAAKKTAKATEAKKAAEPKAKKATKATKTATKAKAAPKAKKTTTKKKPTEEETVSNDVEATPESELTEEPVEQPEELEEVQPEPEEPVAEMPEPVQPVAEPDPMMQTARETPEDDKINAHRIFITRIAFEATKDDLEEYFKKFGTVYDAYCPKQNSYSALNKGFGFISFDSEESIQKVFETAPHIIMGREVIVDRATGTQFHSTPGTSSANKRQFGPQRRFRDFPDQHRFKRQPEPYGDFQPKFRKERHFDREPYNPNLPPYRQNSTSSTFDPNKPVSFVFSGSRSESRSQEPFRFPNQKFRDRNAPKLFVGRIGFETTVQSLRSYFSQFGEVTDVYIPKDAQTQRGKGFGFLTFASKSSVHTVLDPNVKHVLDGREIIVDYADVHGRRL